MDNTERDTDEDLLAVPVWSQEGPSAAAMLGIGRSLAYAAAAAGEIPTVRVRGRVLVPVDALRRMLQEQS